jgi:hypothetical protein
MPKRKLPGRVRRARPAGRVRQAARGGGVGARNQARRVPADRPPRRDDGAALDPEGRRLHEPDARHRGRASYLKAESFTIDGEAVVIGLDACHDSMSYAVGDLVFEHACRLGAEGIVSKRVDAPYRSGPHAAWIKVRNPASIAVQRKRSENWNSR